jgi:hypothetical protein
LGKDGYDVGNRFDILLFHEVLKLRAVLGQVVHVAALAGIGDL